MTVRRLLFFVTLLPTLGAPIVAANSGLLASLAAFYLGLFAAGAVAFWPRTEREREREIHIGMARNLSGADPR